MTSEDFLTAIYILLRQKIPTALRKNILAGSEIAEKARGGDVTINSKTIKQLGLYKDTHTRTVILNDFEYELIGR